MRLADSTILHLPTFKIAEFPVSGENLCMPLIFAKPINPPRIVPLMIFRWCPQFHLFGCFFFSLDHSHAHSTRKTRPSTTVKGFHHLHPSSMMRPPVHDLAFLHRSILVHTFDVILKWVPARDHACLATRGIWISAWSWCHWCH